MSDLLINLGFFFIGLNTLLFTFFVKVKRSPSLHWFLGYVWCMAMVQLVMGVLATCNIRNLWLSHFYFTLQLITVSMVYRNLFQNRLLKRIIPYITLAIVLILIVLFSLNPDSFFVFNVPEVFLCSVPLVVYAIIYLYRSIDKRNKKWLMFSGGLMLYLLSSSLMFSGGYMLLKSVTKPGLFTKFWDINNVIYIIYQALVTLEWADNFRRRKQRKA